MQIARGVAALISAMALSSSSFAATVTPEQGIVLVNRGNGYQNVTGPTNVNPGDILVVNPGGSALLAYDDGCFVPVAVGTIVTVGAKSPCATQGSMTPTQATGPAPQGPPPEAEGGVAPDTPPAADGPGFGELALNVAVAGAVVGGILVTQKDKPASP
jgi:hypothetical protein